MNVTIFTPNWTEAIRGDFYVNDVVSLFGDANFYFFPSSKYAIINPNAQVSLWQNCLPEHNLFSTKSFSVFPAQHLVGTRDRDLDLILSADRLWIHFGISSAKLRETPQIFRQFPGPEHERGVNSRVANIHDLLAGILPPHNHDTMVMTSFPVLNSCPIVRGISAFCFDTYLFLPIPLHPQAFTNSHPNNPNLPLSNTIASCVFKDDSSFP